VSSFETATLRRIFWCKLLSNTRGPSPLPAQAF
jgi:hypothetical protein